MSDQKTRPTDASVEAFLSAVEPLHRREDAHAICLLMERLSGERPRMWGAGMVGFGTYRYRYESGHSGEYFQTGFSPRKTALVIYIIGGLNQHADLLDRLGRFTAGKSCLYVKRLSDIDSAVLEELIQRSLTRIRKSAV